MAHTKKILILAQNTEESASIARHIKLNSEWQHSFIDTAHSTIEATKELSIRDYLLVLLDCEGFDLSPLEALIRLRSVNKKIPLVLINQPGHEKTAISCLKNGASYYLIKEFGWEEELLHVMESVLFEHRQQLMTEIRIQKLTEENIRLKERSVYDEPTQFYSAEHFKSLLSQELKRAARYGSDLVCLIIDIQSSKKPSEAVYEKLSLLLKSIVRSCDIWARLDTDRFVALLPHTSLNEAKHAAKRIGSEISGVSFENEKDISLKVKWGTANFNSNHIKDENELIRLAEMAMDS